MANTTAERVPDEMIERAKSVDLRSLAERYTDLRHCSGPKELEGPCPKCGGTDRFHVTADWFFCRSGTCHPKRGDSIEFLRWLQPGLSFAEAVQQLAGGALPAVATRRPAAAAHRAAPAKPQPATWRRDAERLVAEAYERFWGPEGEPARAYLERRALEPHIWLTYRLGFVTDAAVPGTEGKQRAPAVVMPWRSVSAGIYAVRFRFLEPQGEHRITAEAGSQFAGKLFGGQALPASCFEPVPEGYKPAESLCTLLIVEGEINAMSCHQVAGETRLDVLSVGSESADLSPAAIEFAKRYGRVLLWADKTGVAQRLMGALPGSYGVRSPGGQDANDLLRAGLLGGFLATVRADAARDAKELEGLLWNLWDASLLVMGVDTSTAAVIGELAKRLGKQAKLVQPEPGRWVAACVYEKGGGV